jgi:AcrR family transcriptional regulator
MANELKGPEAIRAARENWRRGQIVEAATHLMASQGFQGMSIAALAEEAGISVGTVYQYVERKEDILLLVILDILEAYRTDMPRAMEGIEDPIERLAVGFRTYCRVVDQHHAGTLLGYRESGTLDVDGRRKIMELELETNGLLAACLEAAREAGLLAEININLTSYDLIMLAHMWALKHWHLGRIGIEEYVDEQLRIMLRAILRPEFHDIYGHLLGGGTSGTGISARRRRGGASPKRRSGTR